MEIRDGGERSLCKRGKDRYSGVWYIYESGLVESVLQGPVNCNILLWQLGVIVL